MLYIPSFDDMTNLTPYFNHVIPAYAGIQTVSHSASQVEEISETGSLHLLHPVQIHSPWFQRQFSLYSSSPFGLR